MKILFLISIFLLFVLSHAKNANLPTDRTRALEGLAKLKRLSEQIKLAASGKCPIHPLPVDLPNPLPNQLQNALNQINNTIQQ